MGRVFEELEVDRSQLVVSTKMCVTLLRLLLLLFHIYSY